VGEESAAPSVPTIAEDCRLNCVSCTCRTGWAAGDWAGSCAAVDAGDGAGRCAASGAAGVKEKKLTIPMILNLRTFFIFYLVAVADKCDPFSVRRPGRSVDGALSAIHIGQDLGFALPIDGQQPDIDMFVGRMYAGGGFFLQERKVYKPLAVG